MRPAQLGDFRVPTDPQLHPDGLRVAFVVTQMDLGQDSYVRRIWLWDGSTARPLTSGPSDTSPRWAPDGSELAFLRTGKGDDDVPQVMVLPMSGGEPQQRSAFSLGVQELEWAPDGDTIGVVAKEWTELWDGLDVNERKRRPRRITRLPYREDNNGWVHDRRRHIWLLDPAGEDEPRCLTPGEYDENELAWSPDGRQIAFVSARHTHRGLDPGVQAWRIDIDGGEATAVTDVGLWEHPTFAPSGHLHVIGSPDIWAYPTTMPLWRVEDDGSFTDLTGALDRNLTTFTPALAPAGPQWTADGSAFSTLEDEGRVRVVRIQEDGTVDDLVGGDRTVTGVSPRPDGTAAAFCAGSATDPGELWWWEEGTERCLTNLNEEFTRNTLLVEPGRFTIDHDGVSVEGWVYLPPGEEKVPLLLNIHGGPATQYGYRFFDEFQICVGAGFGVVAINPRGSSGYGREHVRAVVGSWHEADPPDMRDLRAAPDIAAEAFPRLDLKRMGVMGGSYGGLATVRLLSVDHRYRSAIAERGLYSWPSFSGTSDIGPWFDRTYLGVQPPEGWDKMWQASPLSMAHRIVTPTMVLHSESDWRTPSEQGEQLFTLLLRMGVDTELVRFPDPEGHELSRSGKPRHRLDRFEIVLDWHRHHLGQ